MERTQAKWMVTGLVVAHVMLHGIAVSAVLCGLYPDGTFSPLHFTIQALLMLGPAQATLLAVWVALGGGKFVWRALPTALGTILYVGGFSYARNPWSEDWLFTAVATMGVSLAMLLLARWLGLRLARSCDSKPASGPFQFYIRDILLWTTAVAIVLSGWRCLPKDAFAFLQGAVPLLAFAGLILIVAAAMFAALGRGWIVARVLSPPTAVVLTAKFLNATLPSPQPTWYFAIMISLMLFWLLGSLLVLRLAGYRLGWRAWRAKPQAENTV
jgi:hypothetical protein